MQLEEKSRIEAERLKNKSKKEKILSGLSKSKYVLLKNQEDLQESEQEKLKEVKKVAPILSEMHELKEELRNIFETQNNWSEGLLNERRLVEKYLRVFPQKLCHNKKMDW